MSSHTPAAACSCTRRSLSKWAQRSLLVLLAGVVTLRNLTNFGVVDFAPKEADGNSENQLQVKHLQTTSLSSEFEFALNTTRLRDMNRTSVTGRLFLCGFDDVGKFLAPAIFPEYAKNYMGVWGPNDSPASEDILVHGMFGGCWADDVTVFPGKILFTNGEPQGDNRNVGPAGKIYQIGMVPDSENSVLVYFCSMVSFVNAIYAPSQNVLFDHAQKPITTGKYKAVAYTYRNCFAHREQAVRQLARFIPVHYGGECFGGHIEDPGMVIPMPRKPEPMWISLPKAYQEYRFCLVMDKIKAEYYISEKLMNAFLGGCVPIYWGTEEVFNIFNRNAFIYMDVQNATSALERIQYLMDNEEAYWNMVRTQPILADAENTIRDYFSLSDDVGNGYLKNKILAMMDLPTAHPIVDDNSRLVR
jgi:Glycosyltransferase family 10 (fucosyltransferase) C-term